MFRLIAILLMTAIAADRTRAIAVTGRTLGDPGYSKANDPLGYWVVLFTHAALTSFCLSGLVWLIYAAALGIGPYASAPFFSTQEQSKYAFLSLLLAGLAYVTFARRLKRILSEPPRFRRKTYRQKRRRGK
jgi:membrane protein implicated in regulation of membrane protease activity